MISLLMGWGLSSRISKLVAYVAIPLLVAGLLFWFVSSRISNYGDKREQEGVDKERAAWVAAGEKLKEDAAASATKADDKAVARLEEYKEQADEDRKAIDEAVENGTSPLDAIFGG